MKRIIFFLNLVILLVGCEVKPNNLIKEVKKNMENLNSYSLITNIVTNYSENDFKANLILNSTMEIKNNIGKFTTTANNLSTEGYVKISDHTITYTKENDKWYYSNENSVFNFNILNDIKDIKKLTSDNKDRKFKIFLDNNIIKNILNLDDNYTINDGTEIYLYVTKKNLLSKLILNVPILTQNKAYIMDVTMIFDNYNKIDDIKIPDEVINNAIDNNVLSLITDVENYILEVEYDTYKSSLKYTNCNLQYNGIKPDIVDLNIKNGLVIDGNIVMKNYDFKIKDSKVVNYEKN